MEAFIVERYRGFLCIETLQVLLRHHVNGAAGSSGNPSPHFSISCAFSYEAPTSHYTIVLYGLVQFLETLFSTSNLSSLPLSLSRPNQQQKKRVSPRNVRKTFSFRSRNKLHSPPKEKDKKNDR